VGSPFGPPVAPIVQAAAMLISVPSFPATYAPCSKTADIPVAEIAARFGIARSTLYRTILRPAA
jgi:hypothetical protein